MALTKQSEIYERFKKILKEHLNISAQEYVFGNPSLRPLKETDGTIIYIYPQRDNPIDKGLHHIEHHLEYSIDICIRCYDKERSIYNLMDITDALASYINQHPHLDIESLSNSELVTRCRVVNITYEYNEFFAMATIRLDITYCSAIMFPE